MNNNHLLRKEEVLTVKASILYILKHLPKQSCTPGKVLQIIVSAYNHYILDWASPMFDDTLYSTSAGVVPITVINMLKVAQGMEVDDDAVLQETTHTFSFHDGVIVILQEPDMHHLPKAAEWSLDVAFEEMFDKEYPTDLPSIQGCPIVSPLEVAKAAGADEGRLAYLEEYLLINKALGH